MSEFLDNLYGLTDSGFSAAPEKDDSGKFVRKFKQYYAGAVNTGKATVGALLNSEALQLEAELGQQEAQSRYSQPGDVDRFSDIDSLADFGNWLAGAAGETAASVSQLAVGGGAGGGAARLGGMAVAKGVAAGGMATSFPQSMGENVLAIRQENDGQLPEGAAAKAAAVALLQSGLEVMPFMDVARKMGIGKQVGKEVIQRTLSSPTRIRQIGRTVGTTALQEGATEAAQEALKLSALEWVNDSKDRLTQDNFIELMDSFMAGAVGGGMMGGVGGASQALHSDKPWFKAIEDEKQVIADEYGRTGDREKLEQSVTGLKAVKQAHVAQEYDQVLQQTLEQAHATPDDPQVLPRTEQKTNAQNAPEADNPVPPIVDDKMDGYADRADSAPDSGFETNLPAYLSEPGDVGEASSGIDSVPVEPVKPEQQNEELSDGDSRNFGGAVGAAEDQQYRDGSDAGVIPGGGRVTGGDNQGSTGVEVSDGVDLSGAANTRVGDDSLGLVPTPEIPEIVSNGGAKINTSDFSPTHELQDGTPVIAHPEDAGVWMDSKGGKYEDSHATPLAETTEGAEAAPVKNTLFKGLPVGDTEPPPAIDAQGVHAGVLSGAKAEDGVVSENPPDAVSGGFAGSQSGGGVSAGDLADDGGAVLSGAGEVVDQRAKGISFTDLASDLLRTGNGEAITLLQAMRDKKPEAFQALLARGGGTLKLREVAQSFKNSSLYGKRAATNRGHLAFDSDVEAIDSAFLHVTEAKRVEKAGLKQGGKQHESVSLDNSVQGSDQAIAPVSSVIDQQFAAGKKAVVLSGEVDVQALKGDGVVMVGANPGRVLQRKKPGKRLVFTDMAALQRARSAPKQLKRLADSGVELVLVGDRQAMAHLEGVIC